MAVAAVTNTGVTNLDSNIATVAIPFVGLTGHCVVVHIGVASATVTVASVVDNFGNVYVKQANVLAQQEVDYSTEHYDKNAIFSNAVDGECWAVKSGGAVATITVTLTAPARFAVEVQSYSGGSGFGVAGSVAQVSVSEPAITLTTTGANSFVSVGFSSVVGLNEAGGAGDTLRGEVASAGRHGGIAVTSDDSSAVSLGTAVTVSVTSVAQVVIDGVTLGQPNTFAVCAVEVRS